MTKPMIYAANWKMCLSLSQAAQFAKNNTIALAQLAQHSTIILCPSATAIHAVHSACSATGISIAGQNCSAHITGAFTGQVAAIDLAAAGATYCIVGHSECRKYNNESAALVAEKTLRITEAMMTPIICIGETADEFEAHNTEKSLDAQLNPVLAALATISSQAIIIAYEPVWAIGTGKVPSQEILKACFLYLSKKIALNKHEITLLYGGSVTSQNAPSLKSIPFLDGFLIGGASLDFQEFKKIVEC